MTGFLSQLFPTGVSIERKVQAGFVVALVCLGVVGVMSYFSLNRLRGDEGWTRHTEVVISSLRLLLLQVTDAETCERGYIITGEEGSLEPYRQVRPAIGLTLQSLHQLTADNVAQQRRLDMVAPLVARRVNRLDEVIELRHSQGFPAAQAAIATRIGTRLHDQIRRQVAEMETAEHILLLEREAQAKRSGAAVGVIIIGGSGLALSVVALALLAIGRDLGRRRAQATQAALAGRLSRMGAWVVELPAFKVLWSDEVCAIHEVPPGFLPPLEDALNFYAPEYRGSITEAFGACARDGTPFDVELQLLTARGRRVWVRSIGEAERDAAGAIRRVQGAFQDISDRKQAEEEARQLAERLTTTLESLTDGFFTLDLDWRFTFVNREAQRMLQLAPLSLLGKHIWTIFPEALGSISQREYERALRDNVAVQFESFYPPLDAWYHVRAFPSAQGLAVYFRDITATRHNEKDLRWKTALLEAQVHSSLDGMVVVNEQGQKILYNQRFADLWKTPRHIADDPDDEKQLRWNASMSKDPAQFAERVAYLNAHPNESSREEIELTDGTVLDRYTAPVIGLDGEHYGRIRMIRDITERRRAEEALRTAEEDFRTMANNISQLAWMADAHGYIFWYNDRWFDYSGTTLEEMAGWGWQKVHHPDHVEQVVAKITRCFQSGEVWDDTFPLRGRDGVYRWFLSRAVPIRDAEGKVLRWFGTNTDVTAIKTLEAELAVARDQALESVRMKSEFLANMSHEIRTPMNGVIGMTGLLLETKLNQEQRDYLGMAKSSAHALLTLINDILDFSKIEAGKLEMEAISFSLRDCLGMMLKPLGMRTDQKGIELTADIPAEVPDHLIGDPMRLRQILTNLTDNAIKFTSHGDVMLRVAVESATEDGQVLHFSVADTGIGIPREKQALIFEAFAQVDGSTTRSYGGTGLGLAIASQLVRQMGGRIWVESALGEGATFHFTAVLPARSTPAPNVRHADPRQLAGARVLVVDDNAVNRRILHAMLANWRMQPTAAASGPAALVEMRRAARAGAPYRLVILDGMMPGMDGFAVAKKIGADHELTGATMVMLSSAMPSGVAARCSELGVAGYLTKPVSQSELLHAILGALGGTVDLEPAPEVVPIIHFAGSLRILLAEDNAINRALATALLEKRGHSLAHAANGHEALAAAAREVFDVIFMDVQMPGMDGFETTRHIREAEQTTGRHTPIIAMTAHAMTGDRERCLAAGMDDYLSKPLQKAQLLALLQRVATDSYLTTTAAIPAASSPGCPEPAGLWDAASVTSPDPWPIFSRERLLAEFDGDEDLLRRMIALFHENTPQLLHDIRGSIVRRDPAELAQSAHVLLSSLGIFGAHDAHLLAQQLETQAHLENYEDTDRTYAALARGTAAIHDALATLAPPRAPARRGG